jgi:hypothetical protein
MFNPIICAKWDGCSVWLQWDQPDDASGVLIRLRMRPGALGELMERKEIQRMEWSEWRRITAHRKKSGWLPIAVHRNGWDIEVQVSGDGENWETARFTRFARARCRFSVSCAEYPVVLRRGVYSAVVDGSVCSYALGADVSLSGLAEVEMVAEALTPWSHIDRAGDFRATSGSFLLVNVCSSEGGIEYEETECATLAPLVQAIVPIRVLKA